MPVLYAQFRSGELSRVRTRNYHWILTAVSRRDGDGAATASCHHVSEMRGVIGSLSSMAMASGVSRPA